MFEFECWKCDKWHTDTARGVWYAARNRIARPGIRLGKLRLTIPARLWNR